MKWLLLAVLCAVLLWRRHLLGDLVRSVRLLPKSYREGAQRMSDPAAAAKPVDNARGPRAKEP